ncbi:MAG: helix-turn-helix transcriptional regulator [Carnobacterium maltaromaticum]
MRLSERLKEERKKRDYTQEDVAKILGVSRTTVSSWEVGRTYPDLETLVALSDLYELTLDELVKEDTKLVETVSKQLENAKKWKWMLLLLFVASLLVIIYSAYNENSERSNEMTAEEIINKNYITPISNYSNIQVTQNKDDNFSPNIEANIKLKENYVVNAGVTQFVHDNSTLYVYVLQSVSRESIAETTTHFSFGGQPLMEGEQVKKIVLVENDIENLKATANQKIIWEK